MSDYTKLTNFAVKDGYTTGNPAKVIKGTELDDEFNAIATAVATKVDSSDIIPVANGGTGSTTASGARSALDVPSTSGSGATGTWGINISGNAATATNATNATNATTASVANSVSSTATGTTQATSDDSTKLATTAFVKDVSIGFDQTWQDVKASRAGNTTYTNSTGKPIQLNLNFSIANDGDASFQVDSLTLAGGQLSGIIIPAGSTYRLNASNIAWLSISAWNELR